MNFHFTPTNSLRSAFLSVKFDPLSGSQFNDRINSKNNPWLSWPSLENNSTLPPSVVWMMCVSSFHHFSFHFPSLDPTQTNKPGQRIYFLRFICFPTNCLGGTDYPPGWPCNCRRDGLMGGGRVVAPEGKSEWCVLTHNEWGYRGNRGVVGGDDLINFTPKTLFHAFWIEDRNACYFTEEIKSAISYTVQF